MGDIGKRTPDLRLSEFEGEWVERPLGESFSERVQSDENGELLSVTVRTGVRKFSEIGRHNTSNADKSKYKLVEVGDIAYNSMRMWQGASGRSPYRGIVSPAYTVLAPKAGVESGFFARLFKTPEMIATFEKNSQGLTSDTWNLKYPALSKIEAHMPELSEQEAISAMFDNIERLIDASEVRHEALLHLRQTMLVKMFPQGDAREPEIRFDGFEGEWGRCQLSDAANDFKYGLNSAAKAYDRETKYLRITDIGPRPGFVFSDGVTSPSASPDTHSEFLLENGDIVVARTGATTGRSLLYRSSMGRTVWAGFLIRIKPAYTVDSTFLYNSLLTDQYWTYVKQTSQRSGQPGLNARELAGAPLLIPSLEEQRAIGSYFRNLDELIEAESTKVEKLRNLKAALFEKMFV